MENKKDLIRKINLILFFHFVQKNTTQDFYDIYSKRSCNNFARVKPNQKQFM